MLSLPLDRKHTLPCTPFFLVSNLFPDKYIKAKNYYSFNINTMSTMLGITTNHKPQTVLPKYILLSPFFQAHDNSVKKNRNNINQTQRYRGEKDGWPNKRVRGKKEQKQKNDTHPGQYSEPSISNMGASCSFKDPENTQIHTCNLWRLFGEYGLELCVTKANQNNEPANGYEEGPSELHCGLNCVWDHVSDRRPFVGLYPCLFNPFFQALDSVGFLYLCLSKGMWKDNTDGKETLCGFWHFQVAKMMQKWKYIMTILFHSCKWQ